MQRTMKRAWHLTFESIYCRGFLRIANSRHYVQDQLQRKARGTMIPGINLPRIEYDTEYICNPANRDAIRQNIKNRRSSGDIDKVLELYGQEEARNSSLLESELSKIPNITDPRVSELGDEAGVRKHFGSLPSFAFEPQESGTLGANLRALKMERLGPVSGQRSYAFLGPLAELERGLVDYTLTKLKKHDFSLVSVPDILPTEIIKRCGLLVDDNRTLVYQLKSERGQDFSLSGTAEMALAYKIMNARFSLEELPLKLAAVSRCFRAEVSNIVKERGLYRVHQFTKVEMFACSSQKDSGNFLQQLLDIQESILSELKLHCRILDMPPFELGSPAYRKFDIEAWMPGKGVFGELTSCSNCTDFQSRRLNIKYKATDGKFLHVHTLNGTACAIPRTIVAILETYQRKNGDIVVPEVLIPHMNGKTVITRENMPEIRGHKFSPNFS